MRLLSIGDVYDTKALLVVLAASVVVGVFVLRLNSSQQQESTIQASVVTDPPYTQPTSEIVYTKHASALENFENGSLSVNHTYSGGRFNFLTPVLRLLSQDTTISTYTTNFSNSKSRQLRIEMATTGSVQNVQYYENSSNGVEKFKIDNKTYYTRVDDYTNVTALGPAADIIDYINMSRELTEFNGQKVFRYSGTLEPNDLPKEVLDQNNYTEAESKVRDVSLVLYVRPSGLVVMSVVSTKTDLLLPNVKSYRSYSALSNTDVEQPDWAQTAYERLNRVSSVITVKESSEKLDASVSVKASFSNMSNHEYGFLPAQGPLLKRDVAKFSASQKPNEDAVIAKDVVGPSRKVAILNPRRAANITLTYNNSKVDDESLVGVAALGGGYPEMGAVVLPPNRTYVNQKADNVSAAVPRPREPRGEFQRTYFFPVDLESLRYDDGPSGLVGITLSEARAIAEHTQD